MKGFIITLILFALMLGIIMLNFYFVDKSVNDMQKRVEDLQPIPCAENALIIDELDKNWDKFNIWLSLSVSYEEIEELTNMIDATKAANETNDIEQFKIHVNLLLNAIEEIGRLEKFSIKNIL